METSKKIDDKVLTIPFASYEMQQDRFLESYEQQQEKFFEEKKIILEQCGKEKEQILEQSEKDKKRLKHIIVILICVIMAVIVGIFGTAIYIVRNYEIASYSQDVNTGNANFIGNDGDTINGEADYLNSKAEAQPSQRNDN